MKAPAADLGPLANELRALPRLSRHALAGKWGALYGAPPPPRTSRSLMIRAVAYRLQERAYGGLSPATRRFLVGLKEAGSVQPMPRALRSGTVLLREWQGVTHRVTVIEDGVIYSGKRYRSLSEVARVITGSRWSGPRFFGLKAHAKA
jgi:DUF2924 family protein